MKQVVVLDGFAVRQEGKGVSRALLNILPRLVDRGAFDYRVLATREGSHLLEVPSSIIEIVSPQPSSYWEQLTLPRVARELAASTLYTLRECGPLWGPRAVVHITEVPEMHASWSGLKEVARSTYERVVFPRSVRRAATVLAISKATAMSVEKYLGMDPGHIEVAHLGVDRAFFTGERGGQRTFIFHLGSSDPRDNTLGVVAAYEQLKREKGNVPELVVAGPLGSIDAEISGRKPTCVQLRGRVSDQELADLLSSALFAVQPSKGEGFGLQPLEAMAAGAPVIALDNPAAREVVGDDALLAPSSSVRDLAYTMARLIEDDALRAELSRRGQNRAATFTWETTTENIEAALTRVVD